VSVGKGLRPQYSWTPSPAYLLQVYEGAEDKDGLGVLWSVAGSGGYENKLASPVAHGVPPAGSEYGASPPLVAGKTYTVTVTRKDDKGSGDSFLTRTTSTLGRPPSSRPSSPSAVDPSIRRGLASMTPRAISSDG
jgi:hypothetical protein